MASPEPAPLDFGNVQGDILAGGLPKKTETFFFFQIDNVRVHEFRIQLAHLAPMITTTAEILKQRERITQNKKDAAEKKNAPPLLKICGVNIAFTSKGLIQLGIKDEIGDSSFDAGMLAGAQALGDQGATSSTGVFSPDWDPAFKNDIHGLIQVTGECHATVGEKLAEIKKLFRVGGYDALIYQVFQVVGDVRPGKEKAHEHFGFLDGISQPAVQGVDKNPNPGQETVKQGIVLLGREGDSVTARPPWALDGSFLAFRYLFQLVPEFERFLNENPIPGLPPKKGSELLGARLVGRWKSGAPVDLTPIQDDPALGADPSRNNDFRYDFPEDPKTQDRCPFAAHVRKTNPRADLQDMGIPTEPNRIIRSGIQFGREVSSAEAASGKTQAPRGLLFVSYQSNISKGFEFIQQSWANNVRFPINKPELPGFDPIIGQAADPSSRTLSGTNPKSQSSTLALSTQWVVPKGGEYFFSPSLPALKGTFALKGASANGISLLLTSHLRDVSNVCEAMVLLRGSKAVAMAHIILATLHSHGVDAELSTSKSLVKSRVLFGNLSTTIFDQSSSVPPYERCSQIMSSLATLVPENVCAKETTSGLAGTSIYTNSSNCYTYTSYEYPKSFSPPTQCCDACSIQADQVSVRYWAPETGRTLNATRTARTPYTIVSDGYTYTSPSVYVIYSNLYAQAACTLYPEGHIGPNISVATVAYDPDTLSTAKCYQEGGGGFRGWKAIDYADWYNPPANSVVATQSDCVLLGTAPVSNPGGTDLVASPQFSLPPGLSTLQPAWEEYHCSQWRFGAFDPPRALTKEVSLAPEIATPAAQPSSPFVTPTTTPTPSQGAQDPTGLDPELQHMPLLNSLDLVTTTTDKGNDVPNEDPTTAGSTTNPSPALPLPSVQGAEDSSVDPENSHQDQVPEPEPSQNAGDNISGPDPENPNQDQTPESSPSQDAGNNPSSAVPENSGQDQTTEPDPAQKNAGENPSSADQDPSQDQIPEADPSQDARVNSPSSNLVEADPILPINSSTNLVDGDTILISTPTPTPAPQFTIDNEVITANSQSQNVVQDQTTPGAAAITVFGTPISLAPSAIHLVVGSNTIFLQDADSIQLPPVIVNGATIAANGLSQFIVGDHTITPGAPAITILGTPISIPTAAAQPLTAVGSQAYRYGIDSAGDIIIASETVVPGGAAITLSGEAVSEDSNRTVLVIASGGSASTEGIGQLIAGAFGKGTAPTGNASANASMTGVAFTGEATSQRRVEEIHIAILAAGVAALAACVR